MAKLVVKTGVEDFSIVYDLMVFVDDIIGNFVFIKITKSDFQHILVLHKRDFEKMFEIYEELKKIRGIE